MEQVESVVSAVVQHRMEPVESVVSAVVQRQLEPVELVGGCATTIGAG